MSATTSTGRTSTKTSAKQKNETAKPAEASEKPRTAKPPKPPKSPVKDDITNYPSALRWLYNHTDFERQRIVHYNAKTFSLDRMRKLLSLLGNPQDELKIVQWPGPRARVPPVRCLRG
ncbi:MAG: hypothetical protein HC898_01955 [Phycisphaerales bacterium]|nr:hypothetical protein [Phycisphaerales bacterium]